MLLSQVSDFTILGLWVRQTYQSIMVSHTQGAESVLAAACPDMRSPRASHDKANQLHKVRDTVASDLQNSQPPIFRKMGEQL